MTSKDSSLLFHILACMVISLKSQITLGLPWQSSGGDSQLSLGHRFSSCLGNKHPTGCAMQPTATTNQIILWVFWVESQFFLKLTFIGVQLLYNVVFLLYSKADQLYIYKYPLFFGFSSRLGHHRARDRVRQYYIVPCSLSTFVLPMTLFKNIQLKESGYVYMC